MNSETAGLEDQSHSRTRILKYLRLLLAITGKLKPESQSPPAYHIVAFLRGIMIANVMEHSFWKIQYTLDRDFRRYHRERMPIEEYRSYRNKGEKLKKYYIAFTIVDGVTMLNKKRKGEKISYITQEENKRIFCFEFENEKQAERFLETEFMKIIKSNGSYLLSKYRKRFDGKNNRYKYLKSISWLNKSEEPLETELVRLTFSNGRKRWVPIDSIKIYFTGYLELCPGSGSCSYAESKNLDCKDFIKCEFKSKVKHPDINRIIDFQDHMKNLDNDLNMLIKNRLHNRSRIARMNHMGEKVIGHLLDLYFTNPRIMHDRVWGKLRAYESKGGVHPDIAEWIRLSQKNKDENVFKKELINILKEDNIDSSENNRMSLARRVIEHVAGMTDRFITNEYNRVNQSGREVEFQDEIFLFK